MQEFREGDEGLRPSPPSSQENRGDAALVRLEQIGDLHYDAAAYSSALDYYPVSYTHLTLPTKRIV